MRESLMLLDRAKAGDGEAFAELVEAERPSLERLCFKMTGSREDAEDLVQETLLRAFAGIPKFEMRSSLATWLNRIVTNLCLDHQRHRPPWREERRWQWFQDHGEIVPLIEQTTFLSPEQSLEVKEVAATCLNCLTMTLPNKQRAALILCDQLGFSRQEAADVLHCSVASVKTELHRARLKMTGIYETRCALVDAKNECNACVIAGIGRQRQHREGKESKP
ncbi:MAG: RNA polymerase sigma factor [Dehalococcoidia bacterium]